MSIESNSIKPPLNNKRTARRSRLERIATAHAASSVGTVADAIGQDNRQRLVWLGLLAMPLLFPVAIPGMASAVGVLCLLVALGVCSGRAIALPAWLAKRELSERMQVLIARVLHRTTRLFTKFARPRLLTLSAQRARWLNGFMLSVAGVSMAIPVPMISFDNVLPALAIVLISWSLRLRDGLLLLTGYLAAAAAAMSVGLLWWGGSWVVGALASMLGR